MREGNRPGLLLDSSLLLLWIVGSLDRNLVHQHRRLAAYTARDFDILIDLVSQRGTVYVTPNTLTEATNLLMQHRDPQRTRLLEMLRASIAESEEVIVTSSLAAGRTEFLRLGLTDAVLLEAIAPFRPLVTADLELYLAAVTLANGEAMLFSSFREL